MPREAAAVAAPPDRPRNVKTMRTRIGSVLALLSLAGVLAVATGLALAGEDAPPTGMPELWSDPTFQKQFLGSYGVQAELEPTVDAVEREQMQTILQLMQESDLDGAARELEKILHPEEKKGKGKTGTKAKAGAKTKTRT